MGILNMVNCFGLSAIEMQEMGYWFTLDHQVQIKKESFQPVGLQQVCGTKCAVLHFPPMKQIWVHRCIRAGGEREREREREREGGRECVRAGGNRNCG
jgi:hypothetical protein